MVGFEVRPYKEKNKLEENLSPSLYFSSYLQASCQEIWVGGCVESSLVLCFDVFRKKGKEKKKQVFFFLSFSWSNQTGKNIPFCVGKEKAKVEWDDDDDESKSKG